MGEPIVTSEFHLDNLSDKTARDFLHRAAAEAKFGPVWLVNKAGKCIGKIVPPDAEVVPAVRHADHDPELPCRPALGAGLCYPAPASAHLVPWREALSTDGGDR